MIKRIIYVAKQYEAELKAAVRMFASGAIGAAGADAYHAITSHLSRNGVPHREVNARVDQIPQGHAYWHE